MKLARIAALVMAEGRVVSNDALIDAVNAAGGPGTPPGA